jgi:hypothetical protein
LKRWLSVTLRGILQLGEAAAPLGELALVAVEKRLQPRRLDLAPLQTQRDAVQDQKLFLDPAKPALDPLEPALDPVEALADLAMQPIELFVESAQISERVIRGLDYAISFSLRQALYTIFRRFAIDRPYPPCRGLWNGALVRLRRLACRPGPAGVAP